MPIEVAKVPEKEGVAREQSWWPFLLATTLSLFLAMLAVSGVLALVALVLLLGATVGWAWSNLLREPPEEGQVGGRSRLWWGMVLLIVSETGLFVAGFLALAPHVDIFGPAAPAPFRDLNHPLTLVASLVLWGSGVVGGWAVKGDRRRLRRGLAVTILLGLAFVGYQAFEYRRLAGEGFKLQSGGAGSIFYFLTGLHGAHVLAGLAMLGAVLLLGRRVRPPAVRAAMLYWHFVDAAWVAIYAVLYLKLL